MSCDRLRVNRPLTFLLNSYGADRLSLFRPGPDRGGPVRAESYGWDDQRAVFIQWLQTVQQEVETFSLWDTLGETAARELAVADLSNQPLTKEQRERVRERIQEVRIFVRAEVADAATLKRIEVKLDYLVESSKRMGLKDYANTAFGVLLTVAVEAALDPIKAQQLMALFTVGLRLLIGH
jgi:hypothetical protein